MTPLAEFEACSQPRVGCRPASPSELAECRGTLPDVLLEHTKVSGWCGYLDGAFWLTNPADYEAYVRRIPALHGSLVVARTAFAYLYLWTGDHFQLFTPETGQMSEGTEYPEIFFNSACCSPSFKKITLRIRDFREARKRLGPLEHDECYGYNPIPALGGSGAYSTMAKVKILPYLEILRQAVLS